MSSDVVLATPERARALTDRIKVAVDGTWLLIQEAYESRAWAALGYRTWDEYCTREFGTSRLRLPREERQEVVASLREIGMSIPAIAAATGQGYGTVQRALASGYPNGQPASSADLDEEDEEPVQADRRETTTATRPVIGTDGKRYPAPPPKPPQKPRTDVVATVNRALQRAQEAARAADDITRQHLAGRKDEAVGWHRSLAESMKSLNRLHDLLEENQ